MQRFNLGHNRFTQVPIYEFGSDKLINNEWYFFEVCDWRSYFIPELSDEQCKPKPKLIYDKGGYLSHKFFSIVWGLSGTYAMSKECLTCDLDLWHDPRLDQSICISDRLKDALVKADMADKWFFQACKITG